MVNQHQDVVGRTVAADQPKDVIMASVVMTNFFHCLFFSNKQVTKKTQMKCEACLCSYNKPYMQVNNNKTLLLSGKRHKV